MANFEICNKCTCNNNGWCNKFKTNNRIDKITQCLAMHNSMNENTNYSRNEGIEKDFFSKHRDTTIVSDGDPLDNIEIDLTDLEVSKKEEMIIEFKGKKYKILLEEI